MQALSRTRPSDPIAEPAATHAGLTERQDQVQLFFRYLIYCIFVYIQTKPMEQIRSHAQASIPDLFDQDFNEEPPLKIGTEVFDCTMPSELEF
jgi:hypothetical protein